MTNSKLFSILVICFGLTMATITALGIKRDSERKVNCDILMSAMSKEDSVKKANPNKSMCIRQDGDDFIVLLDVCLGHEKY